MQPTTCLRQVCWGRPPKLTGACQYLGGTRADAERVWFLRGVGATPHRQKALPSGAVRTDVSDRTRQVQIANASSRPRAILHHLRVRAHMLRRERPTKLIATYVDAMRPSTPTLPTVGNDGPVMGSEFPRVALVAVHHRPRLKACLGASPNAEILAALALLDIDLAAVGQRAVVDCATLHLVSDSDNVISVERIDVAGIFHTSVQLEGGAVLRRKVLHF
eukprot:CAMPEP_0115595488 /NCGR_PEP_ID=MMETSP0272-20121206/12346_1 /TAXON_ID=71861 /ORGANISM="Scrippsiella trochoidea, Strain CCMP3099" /LENGTH=218 /DNA_ID=CAMNT_0003030797 /DNA_START=160 /DNA_END=817 /DNA_ORIENTATION=-